MALETNLPISGGGHVERVNVVQISGKHVALRNLICTTEAWTHRQPLKGSQATDLKFPRVCPDLFSARDCCSPTSCFTEAIKPSFWVSVGGGTAYSALPDIISEWINERK